MPDCQSHTMCELLHGFGFGSPARFMYSTFSTIHYFREFLFQESLGALARIRTLPRSS